jgi:hypothetical protein
VSYNATGSRVRFETKKIFSSTSKHAVHSIHTTTLVFYVLSFWINCFEGYLLNRLNETNKYLYKFGRMDFSQIWKKLTHFCQKILQMCVKLEKLCLKRQAPGRLEVSGLLARHPELAVRRIGHVHRVVFPALLLKVWLTGDQIGQIFAFWATVYFGQFFWNSSSTWATFYDGNRHVVLY